MKNNKEMKLQAILLAVFLSGSALQAPKAFDADSPEITYIGRVLRDSGAVRTDWSGTSAIVRFEGKTLLLSYEDTGTDFVNVWVDKEPEAEADAVLKLEGAATVELASFKKKGEHTVFIQKRTEGECGCITFKSFSTDGVLLPARPMKERVIEVIGDSYTCGYGVEAPDRSSPAISGEENCNKSYSGILGRFFDADVVRVAHSGRGIIRNYGDGDPGGEMPSRYKGTFDCQEGPLWEPSYTPSIVVIYLGTNDFSVGKQPGLNYWCRAYKELLSQVRSNYGPDVPILCVASNADPLLADYVKAAVERADLPNVSWTAIFPQGHNITSDLGAAWHPNYQGMRKVASLMVPYISTITQWPLPVKPVE